MRTQYISVTNALNLFEECKINYIRDNTIENGVTQGLIMEAITDFLFFISNGKLDLYGAIAPDGLQYKIPESITRKISWVKPLVAGDYIICNNYDYTCAHNSSVNYDGLRHYPSPHNVYYDLSVCHSQLFELMKSIYNPDNKQNNITIESLTTYNLRK